MPALTALTGLPLLEGSSRLLPPANKRTADKGTTESSDKVPGTSSVFNKSSAIRQGEIKAGCVRRRWQQNFVGGNSLRWASYYQNSGLRKERMERQAGIPNREGLGK